MAREVEVENVVPQTLLDQAAVSPVEVLTQVFHQHLQHYVSANGDHRMFTFEVSDSAFDERELPEGLLCRLKGWD